jgi:hypothetical protein
MKKSQNENPNTRKEIHFGSGKNQVRKMAGTISAAALMLGVSQAATVGFNFQVSYCYNASYSGAVVTGTAFGIEPGSWESLSPMDTGYGCVPNSDTYTLSETINKTSSGGGLNPLPSGSVTVKWSAATANASALFGGYELSPPNYSISPFSGFFNVFNDIQPGNEQVYWGFLRDGVNFGPGSVGGDNDEPGYSIDITGLKSLFPRTPFVVELIASSDSMQYLANAFIIDAKDDLVQSVYYPSTPPVLNVGDTPWVRGIGGGLSTGSEPLNTDHLKIIGNRAAHTNDAFISYNFASTIAGFIVTDKPVISMSPQSVAADVNDEVTLNGYAVSAAALLPMVQGRSADPRGERCILHLPRWSARRWELRVGGQ